MVVLNDRIGAARFVTKTNATSLDTFRAPEEGYLGVVVGGKPSSRRGWIKFTRCARCSMCVS